MTTKTLMNTPFPLLRCCQVQQSTFSEVFHSVFDPATKNTILHILNATKFHPTFSVTDGLILLKAFLKCSAVTRSVGFCCCCSPLHCTMNSFRAITPVSLTKAAKSAPVYPLHCSDLPIASKSTNGANCGFVPF